MQGLVSDLLNKRDKIINDFCIACVWAGYPPSSLRRVFRSGSTDGEIWSGDLLLVEFETKFPSLEEKKMMMMHDTCVISQGVRAVSTVMDAYRELTE